MISLHNVSRWYGFVIGLNDITVEIPVGITALIGQNGSGKTTMIKLITGQLKPTTGYVEVVGENPFANPNVFSQLGYCPEIDNFYERMSGRQFVEHMARLRGMTQPQAKAIAQEMLQLVGMNDRCDRPIQGYSKGMRQRIKLAQAMVHDPKVILLDEPLNGLDPVGRREFISLLGWLAEKGKSIVVSSHILFELEQMTKSILLLHRGRLLAHGDLRVIRALIDKHPHQIRIETPTPRALAAELMHLDGVVSVQVEEEDRLELQVKQPEFFYPKLGEIVRSNQFVVLGVESPDNNMEAVFRYLVEA